MSEDDFNTGFGSLGGEAIEEHNKVRTSVKRDGTEFKLRCDKCNKLLVVTVPWDELTWLSQSALPPQKRGEQGPPLRHDAYHGCFMPNSSCSCHEDIRLGITPDECTRHLKAGIAAGHITAQQVSGLATQIQQALSQRR